MAFEGESQLFKFIQFDTGELLELRWPIFWSSRCNFVYAGLATSSGMGAIVVSVMGLLSAGDIVVTHNDTYRGTAEFFKEDAGRFGIIVHFVNVQDVSVLEEVLSGLMGRRPKMEVLPCRRRQR